MDLTGLLGHYEILGLLGRGGMGEVYRARDVRLGREVALKTLRRAEGCDPDRLSRFDQEARAVAALNHPNIVTIHSVEESEGTTFFTMELIEGRPLDDVVPEDGLDLVAFLAYAVPLADALAAIHARGIIHRDLKPSNVMITRDGHVKMLDFGLAKLRRLAAAEAAGDDTPRLSRNGFFLGTLAYTAPEQLGGAPVDARADVFSLGVLLYEMACGQLPFSGRSAAEQMSAILRDAPASLLDLRPELPRNLVTLIEQCLHKDPDRRPQNGAAVHRELRSIAAERPDAATATRSIAVLPFVDMSAEKDQDYFCDGMAEELIHGLARIDGLRVASRTSSFKFKGSRADIREIGLQLGVETVLEGSVRKAGDRLRITAQLVSVRHGYHLWSERYDRSMEDVFTIQDEISRNIIHSLRLTLSPGQTCCLPGTSDFEAYDYYLRGRKFFQQYRRRGMELALSIFRLAIEHDPHYGLAYAGIADAYCYLFLYAERSEESLRQADEASRKALELAPDRPEVHVARGQFLSLSGRHREAEAEFEEALRLGPHDFEACYMYARDSFAQGKLEKAADLFEQASQANREDYQSPLLVAQIYDVLGRDADAAAVRRRGVGLVEQRLEQHPDDVRAIYMGANGLVALGRVEQGLEWARLAESMEPNEPMVLYNLGCIQAMAGRPDAALELLERAADAGLRQKGWYENDGNLHSLRSHPRFVALLQRLD